MGAGKLGLRWLGECAGEEKTRTLKGEGCGTRRRPRERAGADRNGMEEGESVSFRHAVPV